MSLGSGSGLGSPTGVRLTLTLPLTLTLTYKEHNDYIDGDGSKLQGVRIYTRTLTLTKLQGVRIYTLFTWS